MPSDPPRRRFLKALRKTARAVPAAAIARSAVEENGFWIAHERAVTRSREASETAQRIAHVVAKQRVSIDALADRARAISARAHELGAVFGRVHEVFDRLALVALNAGLEGARLGDAAGRAVLLVSDEVRVQAQRGTDGIDDVSAALQEITAELAQVASGLEQPRDAASEATQLAALAAGASSDAGRALADLDARIRKTTGSDPETARAIAEASEQAQVLVRSIGTLAATVPHDVLLTVVRPILEPLLRAMGEEEGDDEAAT